MLQADEILIDRVISEQNVGIRHQQTYKFTAIHYSRYHSMIIMIIIPKKILYRMVIVCLLYPHESVPFIGLLD